MTWIIVFHGLIGSAETLAGRPADKSTWVQLSAVKLVESVEPKPRKVSFTSQRAGRAISPVGRKIVRAKVQCERDIEAGLLEAEIKSTRAAENA